jgi:SSS family solute:Na+ symporter
MVYNAAPDRFVMILDESNPEYMNLPGIGVLVGGLWVANIYYWGFNQYIIQRTWLQNHCVKLKRNLVSCIFKDAYPFHCCCAGIAAYVMVNDPAIMSD